ncbi:MAG: hypothetical protein ABSH25_01550 [Syntrophorhabdales bacterium]|jgi:hypothetical protein
MEQSPISIMLSGLSALGTSTIWNVMIALAAAGTISMAVLQVIKELTPIRSKYQRRWFERWIQVRAAAYSKTGNSIERSAKPTADEIAAEAKAEVVELATGGFAGPLYDLAIEDLIPQINLAAQAAFDNPKRYEALLAVLSEHAAFEDLKAVMGGQPKGAEAQPYFDARNRVSRRIQRNLDGVRIALSSRWKFWMQVAALSFSTIIVEIAVGLKPGAGWGAFLLALPIGIVGGYLAPVTRDLLAALQKLRNP